MGASSTGRAGTQFTAHAEDTPFATAQCTLAPMVVPNSQKFMQQISQRMSGKMPLVENSSVVSAFDTLGQQNTDEEAGKRTFVQVSMSWHNLTYTVPVRVGKSLRKSGKKVILDTVSGNVPPERLLAVMGPTGCGKTSLINALAGRLPGGGILTGSILVNGQPRTKAFRNICAYVMQDDVLFSNLTVRETLRVAADLRLPAAVPATQKALVVENVIQELGLAKAANTWIGNELVRGVSGGERKRVNVGVELLSDPRIVFLDEPTSGLDAFQAQNVMQSLCTLAKHGRTVVCTIHQPRSSIYSMFDLLLLLSEGLLMYFGPAVDAVRYFSSRGFDCPEHFNPADFFLDVTSMDYRTKEAEQDSQERIKALSLAYNQHVQAQQNVCNPISTSASGLGDGTEKEFRFANSWAWQFLVLSKRAFKQNARDILPLFFSFVLTIFVAVVLGIVYLQIPKDQPGIQDTMGVLFFVVLFTCFSSFQPVLDVFPVEQKVVQRERAAKSYKVLPYYIAKVIAETPIRVLSSLLFSSIIYWMVGLNPGAKQFFIFFALMLLEALASIAFGICMSALFGNAQLAMAVSPVFLIFQMLFAGFYANVDTMPDWLSWIKYTTFLYYAFSGFVVNEFRDVCCWACDKQCLQYDDLGKCVLRSAIEEGGCLRTGNQILDRYGFADWPLWGSFVGLAAAVVIIHAFGYLFLRIRKTHYMPLQSASDREQVAGQQGTADSNGET